MNKKKFLTMLALAAVLTACDAASPVDKERNSIGVTVGKLAVIDGCTVYQIDRGGFTHDVFTTICPVGRDAVTSYTEPCGKNCVRNVEVPTVPAPEKTQERLR